MATPVTERQLDRLKSGLTEDALFQCALLDFVAAATRSALIGLSISDATIALDRLRQQLEKANR